MSQENLEFVRNLFPGADALDTDALTAVER